MADNEQWDILTGVGITALGVAAMRAHETSRPNRLIDDPFAAPLTEAAQSSLPLEDFTQGEFGRLITDYMGVRSRVFDDFFENSGDVRQAVILASGLDARPYRLNWPEGVRLYEIDQPLVLEYKDGVLDGLGSKPTCERHSVAIDLREDWSTALKEAGFDPSVPTAWLAEGLLPYLPADAETNLLNTVHAFSAPGSRLAVEKLPHGSSMSSSKTAEYAEQLGLDLSSLFSYEESGDPAEHLRELGWTTHEESAEDVAKRFGRDLTGIFESMGIATKFLTAEL